MEEKYMSIAVELAKQGIGKVNPNPIVGAVIVKENKIIGQGFHQKYGEAHAEINAINSAIDDISNSTMYVTLEPCSHYGNTPPCVDKIIENKISKVVIGCLDPNPLVAGKGVKKLIDSGIEVKSGVLEEECKKLNEVFIKYITEKKPFVVMKSAMSLDGKIATKYGESKWISCEESRKEVHNLRNKLSAIMVGVETIIKDDPQLTCRIPNSRNPIRVVVDSSLRIPYTSKVIEEISEARTIIATTEKADKEKIEKLKSKGVEILTIKSRDNRVDLQELMKVLGEMKIDSILLEGGATLNFSALEQQIVDKIQVYISPKIIGGVNSKSIVEGSGIEVLKDAFKIDKITSRCVGEDILIEGYVKR